MLAARAHASISVNQAIRIAAMRNPPTASIPTTSRQTRTTAAVAILNAIRQMMNSAKTALAPNLHAKTAAFRTINASISPQAAAPHARIATPCPMFRVRPATTRAHARLRHAIQTHTFITIIAPASRIRFITAVPTIMHVPQLPAGKTVLAPTVNAKLLNVKAVIIFTTTPARRTATPVAAVIAMPVRMAKLVKTAYANAPKDIQKLLIIRLKLKPHAFPQKMTF